MRREAWARLALISLGTFVGGGLAGVGLANYTTTGAFVFYRDVGASRWGDAPIETSDPSGDLASVSDHRTLASADEPAQPRAAFQP